MDKLRAEQAAACSVVSAGFDRGAATAPDPLRMIETPRLGRLTFSPRRLAADDQSSWPRVASSVAASNDLAGRIAIAGIAAVDRDRLFDDARLFSGGIRLQYPTIGEPIDGLKAGILLEVGFANVQPNAPCTISSWAYDHAVASGVAVIDNRAVGVACYHPGYTLVEKLQAISTKFRQQQAGGEFPPNFMRHYYDVFRLLRAPYIQAFVGTDAYHAYKARHFPKADNPVIAENDAFSVRDPATRAVLAEAYGRSAALYYRGQPAFEAILAEIGRWADRL